ncbi:MAG: APC family permease [Pseudomonadota bacterium]
MKAFFQKLRLWIIGQPLDPLNKETRHGIALIAFFAWVGLGADGLSSSCYGPEEAFLGLGKNAFLALYLAIATALTVFIISLAYNQVIELFPTGGGGYRVASTLLGSRYGLVAGAALIVDYVLTVVISVASGTDALFSLFPHLSGGYKQIIEVGLIILLIILNLRGMRESIKILMPIFMGFFISHVFLVIYGIGTHADQLPLLVTGTIEKTQLLSAGIGWVGVAAIFLKAYSMGGGTYTGLEAVSNSVQSLAEPRVRTGKLTMLYVALSLSFMAAGIILLYLLWDVQQHAGQTLNAVVFNKILSSFAFNPMLQKSLLAFILVSEAGLLLVAANSGFLAGPAVIANMAADSWMPHQFRHLSTRLVTQNGILIIGIAALAVLLWSHGAVKLLVVLYSINVFLTFSLSLLGLCVYWLKHKEDARWKKRLLLSGLGLAVTFSILLVTIFEKFMEGGWVTILITCAVIIICLWIHSHYEHTKQKLAQVDHLFGGQVLSAVKEVPPLNYSAPTAIFLVGSSRGSGIHTLLWVQRLFPNHFKNFVFLTARSVDAQSYGGDAVEKIEEQAREGLNFYVNYCHNHELAAEGKLALGVDRIDELTQLAEKVQNEFSNCVFFTSKLVFENDTWVTRLLHNQSALSLQRRLHTLGMQMVILPMKI